MARTHTMQIGIEIALNDQANGEVVLDVEYDFRPGAPASYMEPADPAEIEITNVYWPYKRRAKEGEQAPDGWVKDHFDMPMNALPDGVFEAIEVFIMENHVDDGPEDYYEMERD